MEKFDYRTGRTMNYPEWAVYEVHDGPEFVGFFKVVGGQEVRATAAELYEYRRNARGEGER